MKRFGSFVVIITTIAFMLYTVGTNVLAQYDHMSTPAATPDASPLADEGVHTINTSTGAFYLTITNNGDKTDRLISIETEASEIVEIHDVEMDGNVMQMSPQHSGVEIPPGETIVLEPGNMHAMMIGLTESLIAGEKFNATLTFENAGEVEITVPILRTEPDEGELTAETVVAGDIEIGGIWARHAPKIGGNIPINTSKDA